MSLKDIMIGFIGELEDKVKAQDALFNASRKTITLSKQAVMAIHNDQLGNAEEKLVEARKTLREVGNILSTRKDSSPNISRVAYQEYAEAEILYRLIKLDKFPEPHELEVSTITYLLGLADSIGEFRRSAIESLRKRRLKKAEHCLKIMNEIYSELIVLENAFSLAPELRRKCDVARRLIELTIGDIATETGRSELERAIKQLEKRMRQKEEKFNIRTFKK